MDHPLFTKIMIRRAMSLKTTFLVSAALIALFSCAAPADPRHSDVLGVFINTDSSPVQIDLVSTDGRDTTNLTLSSGQIDTAVLMKGQTKVYTALERLADRRLLSACPTPSLESAAEFFDYKNRVFYFRVTKGRAILLKAVDLTPHERRLLEAYKRQLRRTEGNTRRK